MECEANHYENDAYRDANFTKQKQKQMSACLQLNTYENEGNMALGSGCWLAVWKMSAVSERCRLVAPFQMTFNKLPTSMKTIPLNFPGWDFRCRQIDELKTPLTQKIEIFPSWLKRGTTKIEYLDFKISNQDGFSITFSKRLSNGKFGLIRTKTDESHGCSPHGVLTSLGTEVLVVFEGLSSVLFRRNE